MQNSITTLNNESETFPKDLSPECSLILNCYSMPIELEDRFAFCDRNNVIPRPEEVEQFLEVLSLQTSGHLDIDWDAVLFHFSINGETMARISRERPEFFSFFPE